MCGGLLAATRCGWLHNLTAADYEGRLVGHGLRGGHAMITTLRHRLIAVMQAVLTLGQALASQLPPPVICWAT